MRSSSSQPFEEQLHVFLYCVAELIVKLAALELMVFNENGEH
jgi:uncharacterized protein YhhL (DUF1145 family)